MKKYRYIILDEVHERSLEFDTTVMLMKKYIKENYKERMCPFLILTSATFDVDKYCNYLQVNKNTNFFDIAGSVFPITDNFLEVNTTDTTNSTMDIVKKIHENKIHPMKQGENDILIFVYGSVSMKDIREKLIQYNKELIEKKEDCFVIASIERMAVNMNTIERRIVYYEYEKLTVNNNGEYDYKGKNKAIRRIIIGTNVAETGLTIPTLGFCIDTGWKTNNEYYNPYGIGGLIVKPVDKNNVLQRRGRVGRKFPGHFFTIYTQETFNSLKSVQLPSIVVEDVSSNIIDILVHQNDCFDVTAIDMIDIPPIDSLKSSIEKNLVLGYIESDYGKCYKTSYLGELYKNVRYSSVEEYYCLVSGYAYDVCLSDLITINAMNKIRIKKNKIKLEVILKESLPAFFFKNENYLENYTAITLDDFITNLFIFESFVIKTKKGISTTEKWCENTGLDMKEMIMAITYRLEFMEDLINNKLDPFYGNKNSVVKAKKENYIERISNIKQCLYSSYRLNLIHNDSKERSYQNRFNMPVRINLPNKTVGFPKFVITDKIKIQQQFGDTFSFKLESNNISVLDGYIGIDQDYLLPMGKSIIEKENVKNISNIINGKSVYDYNNILKNDNNLSIIALNHEKYKEVLN